MERYRNLSGSSGVTAYEIGMDFITIEFSDGSTYRYTYESAGKERVERMKGLAEAGLGLNTYINTTVDRLYKTKEKSDE